MNQILASKYGCNRESVHVKKVGSWPHYSDIMEIPKKIEKTKKSALIVKVNTFKKLVKVFALASIIKPRR